MKVLVLGASGMLGFALHRVLHDSGCDVVGAIRSATPRRSRWCDGLAYLHGVDAEQFPTVARAIESTQATVVVNAIGVRAVEASDSQRMRLFRVNSVFPRLMDRAARSLGVYFIHFSSDGVFSGQRGRYDEASVPDAQDPYGVSKFLGEPQGEHSLVLRTSLLGRGLAANDSLVDWFLSQRGCVRGFRRAIFSGLPVNEIAQLLATRILPRPQRLTGLLHLAAAPISKYELLCLLRSAWSLDAVQIAADDTVAIDRSLDATLLNRTIGYAPPAWSQLIAGMHSFYSALGQAQASQE
jgi:dTDP-4-dehydrorhamnose reductase